MTTVYFAQVQVGAKMLYVGPSAKLQDSPFFWRSRSTLRSYLIKGAGFRRRGRYQPDVHQMATQIFVVDDVSKGLKDSKVTEITYDVFTAPKVNKPDRDLVYKLKKADGTWISPFSERRSQRLGKIWNTAGHLRSHLTSNRSALASKSSRYAGALVHAYRMDEVSGELKLEWKKPVLDFYLESKEVSCSWNSYVGGRLNHTNAVGAHLAERSFLP